LFTEKIIIIIISLVTNRAVDTQCVVMSVSTAFDSNSSYPAWGHSMVVGPLADIKAQAQRDEELVIADVDLDEVSNRIGRIEWSLREMHEKETWVGEGGIMRRRLTLQS
jgi:predicted amidohydrolase